jgi:hypothetical protein
MSAALNELVESGRSVPSNTGVGFNLLRDNVLILLVGIIKDRETISPLPGFSQNGGLSERDQKVKLVNSGVTNVVFPGYQAQPSRFDRTRMADNHVKQENAILFARDTIGRALVHFITMLTDWLGQFHKTLQAAKYMPSAGVDGKWETLFAGAGTAPLGLYIIRDAGNLDVPQMKQDFVFALQRRHTQL